MINVQFSHISVVIIILSCIGLISCKDANSQSATAKQSPTRRASMTPAIKVEVRPVHIRPLKVQISAVAVSQPYRQTLVAASLEGTVAAVHITEGQKVRKGDVLVVIEDYAWQARVREKEAEYQSLEAELKRLEKGFLEEEIAEKRALVEEAKAELQRSSAELKRKRDLYQKQNISATEWEEAQFDYAAKKARFVRTQAELTLREQGYRQELVAAARANLARVKAQLDYQRDLLERAKVKAPIDGIVWQKKVEVGEWLKDESTVATLVDLSKIKIETFVPEKYISLMQIGLEAEVSFGAFPGEKMIAQIAEIIPQASAQGRSFPIRMLMENPDGRIKSGMSCVISGILRKVPQAMMIHKDAILRKNRKVFAILAAEQDEGYVAQYVAISLGAREGDWFEITEQTGELVDGSPVVVTNNPKVDNGANLAVIRQYP